MKTWLRYLPAYIPPLGILAFLLATNLFTRAKVFRDYIFPAKNITVSAAFDNDLSENPDSASLSLITDEFEEDTLLCRDPVSLSARALFLAGGYAQAISRWTDALDSTVCKRSAIHNSVGIAYLRLDNISDAEKAFRTAVRADSANASAWYNLGICQSRKGRPLDAAAFYARSLRENPGLSKARYNLGILAMNQGHTEVAVSHFRDALAWGMNKPLCWYATGMAFQRQDSLIQAVKAYRECVRFAPAHTGARLRMSEAYLALGNADSADLIADEAVRIEPDNPRIYLHIERIALAMDNFDKALAALYQAEKLRPDLIEIDYQKAKIHGLKGNNKQALAMYEAIIARDPANPRVYYNIGVNLMDLGMEKEAIDAYTRSLRTDPSYWRTAFNLGVYYLKKNRPADAQSYFLQAAQITPDRPQAHYNLGLAYLRAGNLDKAGKSLSHAVLLDSTYVEARYNLALAYMRDGRNDSALFMFQSVINLSKCNFRAFYNSGLLYRRLGENRIADSCFSQAIKCRNGRYSSAWYGRALCKRDEMNFDSALYCARQAGAQPDSDNVPAKAFLLQARMLDTLGFQDSADYTLKMADSLCGNDPEALAELAAFYTKRGQADHARTIYRRMLKDDSTNTTLLLTAANIEKTLGNPDSAEILFKRALSADSENALMLKDYAELLAGLKRNSDALRMLQNAILIDPGSTDIRLLTALIFARENRQSDYSREIAKLRRLPMTTAKMLSTGKSLLMADHPADAIWFLRNAMNALPGKPDATYYHLLCREKLEKEKFNAGREWTAFISAFPEDHRGYFNMARIEMRQKSWDKARYLLEKTVKIKDLDNARFSLAQTCLALGDSVCAREQITVFIKHNPTDSKGMELYAKTYGQF